jgi:hypothetical protein
MASDAPEMQAILQRIEALERANKRLKRTGLAVGLAAVVVLGMGQGRPSQTVEANRFVLVDSGGVKRAELALPGPNGVLSFFDSGGSPTTVLSPEGYVVFGQAMRFGTRMARIALTKAGLYFTDDHGEVVINLGGLKDENFKAMSASPSLELFGSSEKLRVELGASGSREYLTFGHNDARLEAGDSEVGLTLSGGDGRTVVGMHALKDGANLAVGDREGFHAELGNTDLVTLRTGEKHKTSAASLVLFGKDGKVLWSAP